MRPLRPILRLMVLVGAALLLFAACGDPDSGGTGGPGFDTAKQLGCVQCHTSNGDAGIGPTWVDLYGSEVTMTDGSTVTADRAYLRRAIEDPDAEVVDGFNPIMPKVPVNDAQMRELIGYIASLGDEGSGS